MTIDEALYQIKQRIRYARNMLYKNIDIDLKEVQKTTNELAKKLNDNKYLESQE